MSTHIYYGSEAQELLSAGVNKLADAVKVSLGPSGQTVILDTPTGVHVTKDGVSIAKAIILENPAEEKGARLVKEVASRACDAAGDGTTTATVLTQAILAEGRKALTAGVNPVELKQQIDDAVAFVLDFIRQHSTEISDNFDEIEDIATISANGDKKIASFIVDALRRVGRRGLITLSNSNTSDTTVTICNGVKFDRGYISPYFITNNDKGICEYENPLILICRDSISFIQKLIPVLQKMNELNKPLLIIADDLNAEALNTIVYNRVQAQIQICAVKSPYQGDMRSDVLEDLAVVTGATVVSASSPNKLDNFDSNWFGHASKIEVSANSTIITGGAGSKERILSRAQSIQSELSEMTSQNPKYKHFKQRLATLDAGVAVIEVGANSETELGELKDRVEDALCATQSALKEGYVPGAGTTYIRASKALTEAQSTLGAKVISKALLAPFKAILDNCNIETDGILATVRDSDSFNFGYDARNHKFCDLIDTGIIDPALVARTAIQSSASVASTILTTKALVVEVPEKKN